MQIFKIVKYQNQGVRFEKKFNPSEKFLQKVLQKKKLFFQFPKMLFQIDRVFTKIVVFDKVYIEPFYISKIRYD